MSIDDEYLEPPDTGHAPRIGDPLQMTEAEKRAAEWEARHDVASRGRRAGAETVQHYLAHERIAHPAQPHRAVERVLPPSRQPGQVGQAPLRSRVRRLLRRLLRR